MSLLSIEGFCVAYGDVPILSDIDLAVAPGEILGLVGQSGSGKSTLALAIARLLPSAARTRGRIMLDGAIVSHLSERAMDGVRGRSIGLVFQEPMAALNPLMRVGRQVAEVYRRHTPTTHAEAAARALAMLARVGLGDHARRFPHELSGGQRQRVAIAIAAALAPRLLVADEPTTALDPLAQAEVLDLLVGTARSTGAALILVTHDLAVIAERADRVAVLAAGRLVEMLPVARLGHAAHAATRALVAAFAAPGPAPAALSPGPAPASLLEATGLSRDHAMPRAHPFDRPSPVRVLDGVSLTLARGERLGIVGASGSGKSTLLRLLLGLDTPTAGRVTLDGRDFGRDAPPALRRLIQPVFQDPQSSFDPRWSVGRIVAEPLHLSDQPAPTRPARALAALARVGLTAEHAARRPHQLSGGQRQRVAIARALVVRPAIVALDEAVSALDPTTRGEVLALLDDLGRADGLALLFVSHDLGVIARATDRLVVLDRGRIVEEGMTTEVLAQPRHPATQALVAATPDLARALGLREA